MLTKHYAKTPPAPPEIVESEPPPKPAKAKPAKNGSYDVGYGKPPKHTQFKPNQSGHPEGRKRRELTAPEVLAREISKVVTVTIDGKPGKHSQGEVMIKALMRKAMGGDMAAMRAILAGWQALPPEAEVKASVSKHDLELLQSILDAALQPGVKDAGHAAGT